MKKRSRESQVETRSKKKTKLPQKPLPFLNLDEDSITVALSFLDVPNILGCSELCHRMKNIVDTNQFLWNSVCCQYGMNFEISKKFQKKEKTNYELFRTRLESWKSNYGKIATSNQICNRLRENIQLEIENLKTKRSIPKLYKRKFHCLEEYLPIRSNDQFKDWWFSSHSSNVYLFGSEGKISKFSKRGRVIAPIFKHEDIDNRDVSIVEMDDENNFCLFFNEDNQSIFLFELTTGKQILSIKTVIGHIILSKKNSLFCLHVQDDHFVISNYLISTGETKTKIKMKKIQRNSNLQDILENETDSSPTIVDACISIEDNIFVSILEGIVYIYEITEELNLKKIFEFKLPEDCQTGVDKVKKFWTSPIGRCSLYNSNLIFRIGKKEIDTINKSTWLNPIIYSIDISTGKINWKIIEENKEVFSLHWCISTSLGYIVVTDKNFITCYDTKTQQLKWHRDDSDYESVLKSEDEDFGIPGLYMSSIGFEICGDTLIAYYIREKENSGVVYDMKNGDTLHYLSISSNEKRITNEGKLISCKSLNFEREQHCNIL
eukprot:gene10006-2325_t